MKKTLTVNISGTVFHIEEDAYEQLRTYLDQIKLRLAGGAGSGEIMADIEARIAELFSERLDGLREVVVTADVDHVVTIMGKPEDYVGGAEEDGGFPPPLGHPRGPKRLFRDPDDRWVGGVLAGFAAYFGMDPLWLRVLFILLILLGIGSPIIIYLLLWALIPTAQTAAERLMMHGEPVTVDNLKRAFEEGAQRVGKDVEDLGRRWSGAEGQRTQARFNRGAQRVATSLGNVVLKFIGAVLFAMGTFMAFGLIAALIGGGTFTLWGMQDVPSPAPWELAGLFFGSDEQAWWALSAAALIALVPVIGILLAGLYLLLDLRTPRWIGFSLAPLWIIALVVAAAIGLRVANDLRRSETLVSTVPIQQPAGDVLHLGSLDDLGDAHDWNMRIGDGTVHWDLDGLITVDDSVRGAWAQLDVRTSPDSLFHLRVERRTQGPSSKASLYRSGHIGYTTRQEGDSLYFSPWLSFPKEDKIRGQRLRFIMLVPVGRSVHFMPSVAPLLHDVKNVTNTLDRDMVGRTWTMTTRGLSGTAATGEGDDREDTEGTPATIAWLARQRLQLTRMGWPGLSAVVASGNAITTHRMPDVLALLRPH